MLSVAGTGNSFSLDSLTLQLIHGLMDFTTTASFLLKLLQLWQTFNFRYEQNCKQLHFVHHIFVKLLTSAAILLHKPGEFQGACRLQIVTGTAAGWIFFFFCIIMLGSEISSCDFYFHLSSFCIGNEDMPKAAFMDWTNPQQKGACCSHPLWCFYRRSLRARSPIFSSPFPSLFEYSCIIKR